MTTSIKAKVKKSDGQTNFKEYIVVVYKKKVTENPIRLNI